MASLRILAGDAGALTASHRSLKVDVALLHNGPRGIRWRSPAAAVAYSLGLFYAAGGRPSRGRLIAVGHRLAVAESWHQPDAALCRVRIGAVELVLAAGAPGGVEADLAAVGAALTVSPALAVTSSELRDGLLHATVNLGA